MKRIFLFLLTNIAVMVVLSVVVRLLGLDRALAANGLDVGALLVFSAVVACVFPGLSLWFLTRPPTRAACFKSPNPATRLQKRRSGATCYGECG